MVPLPALVPVVPAAPVSGLRPSFEQAPKVLGVSQLTRGVGERLVDRQWPAIALGLLSVGGARPELALGVPSLFVFP